MHADIDPALTSVIDLVREIHDPIDAAIAAGRPVPPFEFGALAGAVGALLDAIDARPNPSPARTLKAVS